MERGALVNTEFTGGPQYRTQIWEAPKMGRKCILNHKYEECHCCYCTQAQASALMFSSLCDRQDGQSIFCKKLTRGPTVCLLATIFDYFCTLLARKGF